VHAACFVLLAVHRLFYAVCLALPVCAARRAVLVFAMGFVCDIAATGL